MDMTKILYREMTWPEVKEAAAQGRVALVPVGSTEQHGYHLPTMTDIFLCYEVCKRVAQRMPNDAVVLPPVNYGYNEHHLDLPATIHIDYKPWIDFVLSICKSLVHHRFKKIIVVNGHGSNHMLAEIVARRTTLETDAICASVTYLSLARDELMKILEGESSHAGELETSLMFYLAPEMVDMTKAVKDISFQESNYIKYTWSPSNPSQGVVRFMDWWSRMSKTGVLGDPTKSTPEKGKKILEAIVEDLAGFVKEFKEREIRERVDYH